MSNKIRQRKPKCNSVFLNTDIVLLTNEVTFALGARPIIDPDNRNHFLWFKSNENIPDIVICQVDKILHIAPNTFLKEGHIELANLAQKFKYRFAELNVTFIPYDEPEAESKQVAPRLN